MIKLNILIDNADMFSPVFMLRKITKLSSNRP